MRTTWQISMRARRAGASPLQPAIRSADDPSRPFTVLCPPHTAFAKSCMMAARACAGEVHGPPRRRLPASRSPSAERAGRRARVAADARAARASSAPSSRPSPSDDAKRAFSYAAPSIRAMFGTPERFLAMVRAGYPVVYRPPAVTFLIPLRVEGRARPGRASHRRRRRALARHLPARAPARRQSGASPAATCSRRPAR